METALVHLVATSFIIFEIPVAVIVIGLIATILVLNNRRKKPAKAPAQAATTQSYYADVPQVGQNPQAAQAAFTPAAAPGQADPFASFGAAPAAAPAAPAPPAAPAGPANPPPGTPAGWLPDPSGAPNTLRYWDGTAWTQHVAARS